MVKIPVTVSSSGNVTERILFMSFFKDVIWSTSLSLLLDKSLSSVRWGDSMWVPNTAFFKSKNWAMVKASFLSVFVFLRESFVKFAMSRGLMMTTR